MGEYPFPGLDAGGGGGCSLPRSGWGYRHPRLHPYRRTWNMTLDRTMGTSLPRKDMEPDLGPETGIPATVY